MGHRTEWATSGNYQNVGPVHKNNQSLTVSRKKIDFFFNNTTTVNTSFYLTFFRCEGFLKWSHVERKANFDLWLSWVGYYGARLYAGKSDVPVRTPKWPPHLIFAGACHSQETGTVTKTCDEQVSMWAGHVSSQLRWIFLWFFFALLFCIFSVGFWWI